MVILDSDGTTLSFTDAAGNHYSADPVSDWPRYLVFTQTQSDQHSVPGVNANREKAYNVAIGQYNATINAGRIPDPPTPPLKPKQQVVSDPIPPAAGSNVWKVGIHSDVPFDHPLTDPLPLPTAAIVSGPRGPVDSTITPPSNSDLLTVLVTAVKQGNMLLAKIAAQLGVA